MNVLWPNRVYSIRLGALISVQWKDFICGGVTYDLSHLHPCSLTYERPATLDKPAVTFKVDVTYSLHCFSYGPRDAEYDRRMVYPAKEFRVFDPYRYEMSKRLPEIVAGLPGRWFGRLDIATTLRLR
jgi:hypothetical protein